MNNDTQIGHPGYNLFDGFYSTQRGLAEYSRLHKFDFSRFIENEGLSRGAVVDLGCGNGNFLADIKMIFPEITVKGIDKKKYATRLRHEEVIVGDISRGRSIIDDGCADIVVSTTATPWVHSDAIEFFYVEADRILKNNGYGFIFPMASNRAVVSKGTDFVRELGFDRTLRTRKISPPLQLDGITVAATQVLFGDSRLDRYLTH